MITVAVKSHLMEITREFTTDLKSEKFLKSIKRLHDKYPDINSVVPTKLVVTIQKNN